MRLTGMRRNGRRRGHGGGTSPVSRIVLVAVVALLAACALKIRKLEVQCPAKVVGRTYAHLQADGTIRQTHTCRGDRGRFVELVCCGA